MVLGIKLRLSGLCKSFYWPSHFTSQEVKCLPIMCTHLGSNPALEERMKEGRKREEGTTEGEKHFISGKCKGQIGKGVLRVGVQDDRV